MTNPPTQNIFPVLRYRDAESALRWLQSAFGFVEHAVYRGEDGSIAHATLRLGSSLIMFGQHAGEGRFGGEAPNPLASPISLYVVVDDPDAHHARAASAGASIVRPLTTEDYGSREYGARDPEGNLWTFGTYDPNVAAG
jgi:uncharacterized glyoxalase superfamily protein PhnB